MSTAWLLAVLLAAAPPPAGSAEALLEQAEALSDSAPERALELAEAALAEARRRGRRGLQTRALNRLGVIHYYLGDYQRAQELYREARQLAEAEGDREGVANALNNIGILHYVWGSWDLAVESFQQALELRLALGDTDGLAKAYNNLGNVSYAAERYQEALDYYGRSLAVYEQRGERKLVASSHNNIGLVHFQLEALPLARAHFQQALELSRGLGDAAGVALSQNHLGLVLQEEGDLDGAQRLLEQALAVRRELGDRQGVAVCRHNLGLVHLRRGELEAALRELGAALEIALELDVPQLVRDTYRELASVREAQGDLAGALADYRLYKQTNDRIFREDSSRKLAEMRARFELANKDREIERLGRRRDRQRLIRGVLAVVTVLLSAVLLLLASRYRIKVRTNLAIQRKNRDLEQAREELERASRAELAHLGRVVSLGELTAAVAHELNQPLAAILTNAQVAGSLLAGGEPDRAELEGAVEDITLGAHRAWELLDHLRRLARRGEVERRRLELGALLREVETLGGAEARMRGVELELRLPAEPLWVEGDGIHLQQVVLNLLQNGLSTFAAKAAGEGGSDRRLVLQAARRDGRAEVSLEDRGPAVSEEVLQRMFEPFFTTRRDGLGLGLAICRRLVEAHDGEIWARRNPERGLTVGFWLPLVDGGGEAP